MQSAARTLHGHAEAALADFTRVGPAPGREKAVQRLSGMLGDASSSVAYAESLRSPDAPEVVHQRVESSLRRAIDGYYLLGQLLAVPGLVDRPEVQAGQPRHSAEATAARRAGLRPLVPA